MALTAAHERVARSVRLSVGLCEKLDRQDREDARAARADLDAGRAPQDIAERRRSDDRIAAVRAAVRRSIHSESEGERAERFEAALEIMIEECRLNPGFVDRPLNDMAHRLREALGLPRVLMVEFPDPPGAPPDPARSNLPPAGTPPPH